jgi:hypothetical protein
MRPRVQRPQVVGDVAVRDLHEARAQMADEHVVGGLGDRLVEVQVGVDAVVEWRTVVLRLQRRVRLVQQP